MLTARIIILIIGRRECNACRMLQEVKSLHDRFVRELKKVKLRKSGDSGPAYTPTWPLFSVMMFLHDSVKQVFNKVH